MGVLSHSLSTRLIAIRSIDPTGLCEKETEF